MTSKIIVNNIESDVGISSVTFNDTISGNLEGNINSSGTSTFNVISGVSTIGVTTVHLTGINDLSYPTAGPLSHRNMCFNGAMQVAQRGTSSTGNGTGTSAYLAVDRFQTGIANAGTWTISQSTDGPAGFSNSIKYDCTTAETSLVGGSELWIVQKIEAQNLQHLNYGTADAQDCTFSFYFKTNKTGVYTVEIYQADANRTVGFEMNVTQTGWQRYEFVIPGDTAGTINNDTGIGFWCFIWMAAGTNKTSGTFTSGSWAAVVTANRLSSSQVNFADSTSNECFLTGVQLETGSVATTFEYRSYADELARCQRYYQSYGLETDRSGQGPFRIVWSSNGAASQALTGFMFPTPMRTYPTVTSYGSGTAGGDFKVYTGSTSATISSWSSITRSDRSMRLNYSLGVGAGDAAGWIDVGDATNHHAFTLDAEL